MAGHDRAVGRAGRERIGVAAGHVPSTDDVRAKGLEGQGALIVPWGRLVQRQFMGHTHGIGHAHLADQTVDEAVLIIDRVHTH